MAAVRVLPTPGPEGAVQSVETTPEFGVLIQSRAGGVRGGDVGGGGGDAGGGDGDGGAATQVHDCVNIGAPKSRRPPASADLLLLDMLIVSFWPTTLVDNRRDDAHSHAPGAQ